MGMLETRRLSATSCASLTPCVWANSRPEVVPTEGDKPETSLSLGGRVRAGREEYGGTWEVLILSRELRSQDSSEGESRLPPEVAWTDSQWEDGRPRNGLSRRPARYRRMLRPAWISPGCILKRPFSTRPFPTRAGTVPRTRLSRSLRLFTTP